MSKLTRRLTNKCVAAVASLAMAGTLCVAGAVTMTGVAWAGKPGPNQHSAASVDPKAPWDKSNTKTTGSITIFKCDEATTKDSSNPASSTPGAPVAGGTQPASGNSGETKVQTAANGYNKPTGCPAGHKALQATFKVTKVAKVNNETLDYKTESDWAKLADVVNDLNRNDESNITLDTTGTTQTTDQSTGQTKFENLSLGLYKVEETQAPAGYGASDMSVFYITLPLIYQVKDTTDTSGKVTYKTAYDYDPAVAPKNKNLTSTLKKVLSTDKGDNFVEVKDDIVYEISAGVNHPSGTLTANSIKDFAVFDDAPTEAFSTISKDTVIESVTVDGVKSALTKTDDYTVEVSANTDTKNAVTTDGDTKGLAAKHTRILVKFTPTGLGKIAEALNKAKSGSEPQVHVKFKFQLSQTYQNGNPPTTEGTQEADGHNKIVNKSGFFKAHIGTTNPDPNPIISGDKDKGTSTKTFGYLQVHKHDKDDANTGLKDAEFKLFNSKDKADACNASLLKKATEKAPAATQPAGDASATADPCTDGASANFNGKTDGTDTANKPTGKFKNAFKALAGQTIYLVEVKAPENYMRYPGAVAVNLKEGEITTVDFPNTKIKDSGINTPWFFLPKTGAYGILIFAVVGMALIAASVIMYVRNRKEEEQQQNA
ncbi:SpaH/EbpB family LPXTG-anchored major pilin [Gardnerella sp. Marseille-Q2328]|uniref:SpaH/EbpB family LPXTG-anchored major pilin n=1 Tax=Gardnerella sp. Marseille-Q2328 TaxID=2759694 RepID=UPI00202531FB|nr:SpaH/EbpB family LPXTG-anchored major pilin [Gardnerella sp. Marseille-Q2328]